MDLESAILESANLREAAGELGLTLPELLDRLATESTRKSLDDSTRTLYHESMRQLYLAAGRAIDVLEKAARGEEITDSQVSAAKALLSHAEKAREYFSMDAALKKMEKELGL